MAKDSKNNGKPKPGVPMDISVLRKALKANPKTTVSQFKKQLSSESVKQKYPLNKPMGLKSPKVKLTGVINPNSSKRQSYSKKNK